MTSVLEVEAFRSVGPVRFGMSLDEASAALGSVGLAVREVSQRPPWASLPPDAIASLPPEMRAHIDHVGDRPTEHLWRENLRLWPNDEGRVASIEITGGTREERRANVPIEITAVVDGMDVFATPARAVVEALLDVAPLHPLDRGAYEESASFPDLGLTLWREAVPLVGVDIDEACPFFETVLLLDRESAIDRWGRTTGPSWPW